MPISTSLVGASVGPSVTTVDARWAMAYAAGLGDMLDCYIDTRRKGGIIAHPLFPVCVEWQIAGKLRAKHRATLSQIEAARGVHATQHMILHQPIRPPMKLSTTASIEGIERRRPGPYEVVKYATTDESGRPICTTYAGSIYREVAIDGDERPAVTPAPPLCVAPAAKALAEFTIAIPANAAHVYTECAHIWNPIHTDAEVAESAGLPAIMLHGTATLALAVSKIIATEVSNQPERVAEVYGRFGAMVFMPSEVTVRIVGREKLFARPVIFFEAISVEGGRAIRDGAVVLRD
jgi:MaoC like domain/N-terminal half of MaoC dehydratase